MCDRHMEGYTMHYDGRHNGRITVSETELALRTGVSVGALRKWRRQKTGPRYLKLGRLVRYLESDVFDWLESQAADRQPRIGANAI
jgi:predicted DNA-binding transcriptional regulator AlpA